MQIQLPAHRTSAPLPMMHPPVQADWNEPIEPSLTAKQSVRPLQHRADHSFIEALFFTSFHQMRILLRDLRFSMSNLRFVLEGLGAASCGQISVNELLRTIVVFGRWTQEGVTNSRQGAVDSSKTCRLTVEAKNFFVNS